MPFRVGKTTGRRYEKGIIATNKYKAWEIRNINNNRNNYNVGNLNISKIIWDRFFSELKKGCWGPRKR